MCRPIQYYYFNIHVYQVQIMWKYFVVFKFRNKNNMSDNLHFRDTTWIVMCLVKLETSSLHLKSARSLERYRLNKVQLPFPPLCRHSTVKCAKQRVGWRGWRAPLWAKILKFFGPHLNLKPEGPENFSGPHLINRSGSATVNINYYYSLRSWRSCWRMQKVKIPKQGGL